MLVIYFVIAVVVITIAVMYIGNVVTSKAKMVRDNKAFANLPKKILLTYVLRSPVYSSQYYHLRLIMSQDRAADHAIKQMLIDRKIIKYRKEKL